MVMNILKNKRGWLRILEATIAVLLVTGALGIVYSKQLARVEPGPDEYILSLQEKILLDVAHNKTFRKASVSGDVDQFLVVQDYAREVVPLNYNLSLQACSLNDPCKLSPGAYTLTVGKLVFAEDTLISTDIDSNYAPVRVRLFIWEND